MSWQAYRNPRPLRTTVYSMFPEERLLGPRVSHIICAVVTLIAANCHRRKVWNLKCDSHMWFHNTAQACLPSVGRHYKGHASFMCVWVVPIVPCGCEMVFMWNCGASTYSCSVHPHNFSHPPLVSELIGVQYVLKSRHTAKNWRLEVKLPQKMTPGVSVRQKCLGVLSRHFEIIQMLKSNFWNVYI